MTANSAVATFNAAAQIQALPAFEITRDQIELVKQTVMPNASDLELDLFINFCRTKRLDPLSKQVYAIRQKNGSWQFFSSIDGLRVIAQRSGEYLGQTAPFWCGPDGQWRDVWLEEENPSAAKIGVWKRGNSEPTWGVATFKSYGRGKQGNWLSMPDVMLVKCAEALALRKAFPDDLSGVYVREEFPEGESPPEIPRSQPQPRVDPIEAQVRGVPVTGPVVDAVTGEILSADDVNDDIKRLREKLGWSTTDVIAHGEKHRLNLKSTSGLRAMRDYLQAMVDKAFGDDGGFGAAMDVAVGEAGNDRYSS